VITPTLRSHGLQFSRERKKREKEGERMRERKKEK